MINLTEKEFCDILAETYQRGFNDGLNYKPLTTVGSSPNSDIPMVSYEKAPWYMNPNFKVEPTWMITTSTTGSATIQAESNNSECHWIGDFDKDERIRNQVKREFMH